jgi:hypothetical protein
MRVSLGYAHPGGKMPGCAYPGARIPAGKQCLCTFCFSPLFFRVSLPARSAVPRSADQRKHAYAGAAGVDTNQGTTHLDTPPPLEPPKISHTHEPGL